MAPLSPARAAGATELRGGSMSALFQRVPRRSAGHESPSTPLPAPPRRDEPENDRAQPPGPCFALSRATPAAAEHGPAARAAVARRRLAAAEPAGPTGPAGPAARAAAGRAARARGLDAVDVRLAPGRSLAPGAEDGRVPRQGRREAEVGVG